MAAASQYLQKAALDWVFGGASPTQPTKWGVALSLGAPTSVSASEVSTNSGYARQSMAWGAAGTPSGSGTVSNASAITFGPFSTAQSLSGLVVFDTMLSANSGNMLVYGNLATARTVGIGDSLVIASASILPSMA